jgi:hypothetical protein
MAEIELWVEMPGVEPFPYKSNNQHPVLAVRVQYTRHFSITLRAGRKRTVVDGLFTNRRLIYAKDTYFLIPDQSGRFGWVASAECRSFISGLACDYLERSHRRMTRYSLDKDLGEYRNMIYPIRPFSITGISMDGFDPSGEYPVLAIDMDQYVPESQNPEGTDAGEQVPQSQSMAFFLVGDDNGEFAWIAEDECRLYPMKS